jgi:hypothetical protein
MPQPSDLPGWDRALFDELCEYVALMCESFGDKRAEVPCDAWRLRDNISRMAAELTRTRDERDGLKWQVEGLALTCKELDAEVAMLKARLAAEHSDE